MRFEYLVENFLFLNQVIKIDTKEFHYVGELDDLPYGLFIELKDKPILRLRGIVEDGQPMLEVVFHEK